MKFFVVFALMMMVAYQTFALPAVPAPAVPAPAEAQSGEPEAVASIPSGAPKAKRDLYYYTPLVAPVKYYYPSYPTYYYYHPYEIIV